MRREIYKYILFLNYSRKIDVKNILLSQEKMMKRRSNRLKRVPINVSPLTQAVHHRMTLVLCKPVCRAYRRANGGESAAVL